MITIEHELADLDEDNLDLNVNSAGIIRNEAFARNNLTRQ